MNREAYIFIGPSGCGKGTQAKKLTLHIGSEVLHVETGERFREFIEGEKHANQLSKELYQEGSLQPDFLAVYMWSQVLTDEFKGKRSLIFDGTPRSLNEAKILDSAFSFFDFDTVTVIYLNVGKEWSRERLSERGREDDDRQGVERRLAWFLKDVVPAIEYYRENPDYTFLEINGEQTIEEVWGDIEEGLK